eukprot:gene7647-13467_t
MASKRASKFLLLLAVLNIVSSKYRSAFYKQVGNTTDDAALDLAKFHGCSTDDDCDVVTVVNKEGNESALVYKKVQHTFRTCNELREAGWRNSDIYDLTLPNGEMLRVYCDMINGNSFVAIYHGMSIGDESQNFLLKTGRFVEEISTAYDSFTSCDGAPFTTFDRDNDNDRLNCAQTYSGGWWYKGGGVSCTTCSFNTDDEPKWIGLQAKVVLIRILVG